MSTRRQLVRGMVLWPAFLLSCAALAGVQRTLERQKQREAAAEREFQGRLDDVYAAVIPLYEKSPARVAESLNGGKPLMGQATEQARPVTTLAGTVFDDRPALPPGLSPATPAISFRAQLPGEEIGPRFKGWVIHLHFVDDQLRGASVVTTPHRAFTGPPPAWLALHWVLQGMVYAGAGVWCLCALLLPFNRPWRWQLIQVALAGLIVSALAQALGPGLALPARSLNGILHAPLPLAITFTALVSFVGMMMPRRHRRSLTGPPPCIRCGYDLTGNVSGICPECGTFTPRGRVDRWSEHADRVARVGQEQEWDVVAELEGFELERHVELVADPG